NSGPSGHALYLSRPDDRAIAQAVFVLERALDHIGHDLHVTMAVRGKTASRRHPILVDHAQRAKTHVAGIEVLAEGKTMPAIQPGEAGLAALLGGTFYNHCWPHPGDRECGRARGVALKMGDASLRGNPESDP